MILYRKKFRQRPTTHYMRAIAMVDILMIYGWNLDHFLRLRFGFEIDRLTIITCKIFMYFNNSCNQAAAWFRVLMCADRLYTLNQVRQSRTMTRHRTVLLIIGITIGVICLLNLHIPIFTCYRPENSTRIVPDSLYYSVYPMWNYVNLAVYNCLPFLAMVFFDVRIVRHLMAARSCSTVKHPRVQHTSIAASMFLSTFLFLLMTTPSTITFIFSPDVFPSVEFRKKLVIALDSMQYTYHSAAFFVYFATLIEFRMEFHRMMPCSSCLDIRSLPIWRSKHRRANRYKANSVPLAAITK